MKKTHLNVKPFPYWLAYEATKKGNAYGLLIKEYRDQLLVKQTQFADLTEDPRQIKDLLYFLEKNQVYGVHAKEILKDMGYLTPHTSPPVR